MIELSRVNMKKNISERRRTVRHDLRMPVGLRQDETKGYQKALLHNINHVGLYLITRHRLTINQSIEIAVPTEPDEDMVKIRAKVIRIGNHRSWGVFSYGCRILR